MNHTTAARPTASTITDDQLDRLHGQVDGLSALCERQGERLGVLQRGQSEREANLEEIRDTLEAAGHLGAHGDDWPRIAPAVHALAAERDRARDTAVALENENAELTAAVRALAEEFAAGPRTVDVCAVRERLLALVTPRVEHVAGDPDLCPACRLLPASQVPPILCPGPAKEQP